MPVITRAFILGAGLGTRLRPLTESLPKPLFPIFGKPLITFALDHLRAIGVESFVINTHHLPAGFEEFFSGGSYAGAPVRLVHEPVLLETGGGIKNVESFLGTEAFIVYSGDILTDFDLAPLLEEHFRAGNDVTLALRQTDLASGVVLRDGRVIEIAKTSAPGNYDFANVSIWNSQIFARIPAQTKISFIPVLSDWIRDGGKIGGLVMADGSWFNIGSRREYLEVHRLIAEQNWKPHYVTDRDWPQAIAPTADIDRSAELRGFHSIGSDVRIGAEAILENTIVWPGAQIASRSRLAGCIVRSRKIAEGDLHDIDV